MWPIAHQCARAAAPIRLFMVQKNVAVERVAAKLRSLSDGES
jgi:hypothetical protein